MTRALLVVERVAERRADRLPDARLHAGAGREADLGQVGVVDVARQHADRRRRGPPRARRRPRAAARTSRSKDSPNAGQCSRSSAWRSFSPSARRRLAPGAVADRLVPGLEVVQRRAHDQRQRRADQQVVDVAGGVLLDPAPLVGVDHRALAGVEHAPGARVDHHERARGRCRGRSSSACPRPPRSAWKAKSRRMSPASSAVAHALVERRTSPRSRGERLPRCW